MYLGDVIKQHRKERGMSQQKFADLCGLSKPYISQLENNRNPKTGEPAVPSSDTFVKVADAMKTSLSDLLGMVDENQPVSLKAISKTSNVEATTIRNSGKIPVYGRIAAGIPLEANQDIQREVDVPSDWVDDHGALIVKGDSMYPKYQDGDIVIFKCLPDCESGTDCVVYVNGYDATLKTVYKKEDGVLLQPINPAYDPMFYGRGDETVLIAGVVVEIRRKV